MTTFNDLHLEIPDGWEDGTVVTLIGPSPGPAVRMMTKPAGSERPTIALREIKLPESIELEPFVQAQEQAMESAAVDLEVAHRGEVEVGGVRAVTRELCFGPAGSRVRQIQLYFQRADRLYAVMGTAADDLHFDTVRKASISVASSVR